MAALLYFRTTLLGLSFFAWCWWPRESMLQGSSALSEFCTSPSKVLTLWHCVKLKQHSPLLFIKQVIYLTRYFHLLAHCAKYMNGPIHYANAYVRHFTSLIILRASPKLLEHCAKGTKPPTIQNGTQRSAVLLFILVQFFKRNALILVYTSCVSNYTIR